MKDREDPSHRKPWSVSLTDGEKAEAKNAVQRTVLRWPYRNLLAEWGRAVVLDWARYANALPEGSKALLPSEEIARLQAELELAKFRATKKAPAKKAPAKKAPAKAAWARERDRQRELGLEQVPAPPKATPRAALTGDAFAVRVLDAARSVTDPDAWLGDKIFINRVWRVLASEFESREQFNAQLLKASQTGKLSLTRADLVSTMDPRDVAESEVRSFGAQFNFISVPGAGTPW